MTHYIYCPKCETNVKHGTGAVMDVYITGLCDKCKRGRLSSVTLGYCDKLTDARAPFRPLVRYFYDAFDVIKCEVIAHGNLDPIGQEILYGISQGKIDIYTLEDIVDLFSSPHSSMQVIHKEYTSEDMDVQLQRVTLFPDEDA